MSFQLTRKTQAMIICLICVITFLVNNHVITPDIMESRNIITAREMVYDSHWIAPTMNGEPRLEKPPLPTWLTAVAEIIAPDSLPAQRGMAGLAALLLTFYFWNFARRVLRMDPVIPVLLLCTCYNVILMGRTASWDIYCHAFMMGGIYHLARALSGRQISWKHFMAAGLFTGLSIMSKGPVSLYALFLPFLISYACFFRPSIKGKGMALTAMIILSLITGAWWYVYIHLTQTEALAFVVRKESGSWINHNVRPWWYYWKFFLEAGVWSLLLLTSIALPLVDKARRKSRRWLFSLTWMLASLVLLSLMPEKKSRYLLPLLIPACYTMSCVIEWWVASFRQAGKTSIADKWCFRANALLIVLAVAALPVVAWLFVVGPGYVGVWAWAMFLALCLCLVIYLSRALVRLRPMALLGGVTVLFVVGECLIMPVLGNVINNPEMKSLEQTRHIEALRDVPFYHAESEPLRIELVYSAHRSIRPIDITSADSLKSKLPCVLLTHERVSEVLPKEVLNEVDTMYIGRYDDNRRPKNNRLYRDIFIYHATLLKAKRGVDDKEAADKEKLTKETNK